MIATIKSKLFFKAMINGMLGIAAEILLILFFICSGLAVCVLWWGLFK